ncbi:hypothetical protein HanRHA438_Chr04g0154191 [Helianthus annuus]|nr:hypothetical protein HanRHA438_Chr04g0154191 [Helianthus annuus]
MRPINNFHTYGYINDHLDTLTNSHLSLFPSLPLVYRNATGVTCKPSEFIDYDGIRFFLFRSLAGDRECTSAKLDSSPPSPHHRSYSVLKEEHTGAFDGLASTPELRRNSTPSSSRIIASFVLLDFSNPYSCVTTRNRNTTNDNRFVRSFGFLQSLLVCYYKKSQHNQCEYTRSHFRFKHFGCNMYSIFKLHNT